MSERKGWFPNPEWAPEECIKVALTKLPVRDFPGETTRDKVRIERVIEARRCLSAALDGIERQHAAYEKGYRDAADLYRRPRRA